MDSESARAERTDGKRTRRDSNEDSEWVERKRERREPLQEVPQPSAPNAAKTTLTRSGGAYIPPAKLKLMQQQLSNNKQSEEYQRLNFELLKKKINGQINKVNVSNIVEVVRELLQVNVIRGTGILVRALIQAQSFSPSFSHVYAAIAAIVNSKFPNIGQLLLTRLVIQFKRSFRTNHKILCLTVTKFIAHLTNQRVAHEILVLEILIVLMEKPTDDSIEIAITLLKECGKTLTDIAPKGIMSIFDRLRSILQDADSITERVQYMIEVAIAIRKDEFKAYPSVIDDLDLIEEEEQISHMVELVPEDNVPLDPQTALNYFKFDPDFEKNEENYEEIRKKIIGDGEDSSDEDDDEEEDEEPEERTETPATQKIVDMTENDVTAFRRNIYLCIQSSLDYQEAAHKLIKYHLKPGLDTEMCNMIVDCCAQARTYEKFFGLLAERFCRLRLEFQQAFEKIAVDTYSIVHRFDIKKIRIMAQLVAHLLATDAIDWKVLSEIKMTEQDTTSAGRVYIKILFLELSEAMGIVKLFAKLYDPTLKQYFTGLFPLDHPKNTRFAINFWILCGLGGLTITLREEYEKKMKKLKKSGKEEGAFGEGSSSSSSDSSDSSDSSSSDSSSDSDSSDSSSDSSDSSSSSSSDSESEKDRRKKSKSGRSKLPTIKTQIKKEPLD